MRKRRDKKPPKANRRLQKANQNKRSLAHRIGTASRTPVTFASIILGAISIAIFVLSLFNSYNIYNTNISEITILQKFSNDYMQSRVDVLMVAQETNSSQLYNVQQQYNSLFKDMSDQLQKLEKLSSSANIQADYSKLRQAIDAYINTNSNRMTMAYWKNVSGLNSSLGATADYTTLENAISSAQQNATRNAHERITYSAILMICGIALMAISAIIIIILAGKFSRKITNFLREKLDKITQASKQIAAGYLELDIDTADTSEIGELARAFDGVHGTLQNMKADVDRLVEACNQGDLSVQVDSSRHQGIYREIVDGILDIFTTVNTSIQSATSTLESLSNGERLEPIPTDSPGVFGKIAHSEENIRQVITSLHADVVQLAAAGAKGDLGARGDASRYQGIYAEIVDGVNRAFANIQEPMDVVIDRLDTLAAGGHIETENPYQGYPSKLIGSLNTLAAALQALKAETDKLAAAGAVGDLETRGDTSGLNGQYAEILTGFNQTLENILAPLNESRAVLSKIQKHDFASRVDGHYQGAMAQLAADVNEVHDHLVLIETIFLKLARGDTSSLEPTLAIGRFCEADRLTPAVIKALQNVRNLITEATGMAQAAQNGDLEERVDESHFEGGFRDIIAGMNHTMEAFSGPVSQILASLNEVAAGNLDMQINSDFSGSYELMQNSFNQAIDSFNELIRHVQVAASEVSAGSKQVSDASQTLSQSSTEQASAVEQVTATVADFSAQTRDNADRSAKANTLAAEAKEHADEGNASMREMLLAIEDIGKSAKDISKIISTIDSIAFQTNILALNAAVEAARAGQYGKGFTVVADEVRNLATKSAAAAHETAELIEASIRKVHSGSEIAGQTAEKFTVITANTAEVAELLQVIGDASSEQATAISQLDLSVQQISTSVQNNSATAEETAASSEELSGQAQVLLDAVGNFRLRS